MKNSIFSEIGEKNLYSQLRIVTTLLSNLNISQKL